MTEEHQFIVIITLGAAIIGAVAGLAGTLLVPVLTSRIESRREKRNLKSDLVKNIYLFFDNRKRSSNKLNRVRFNELTIRIIKEENDLVGGALPENKRMIIEKLEEQTTSDELLSAELVTRESEIEADIMMILQNILHHHGKTAFEAVEKIIHPHIDKSNNSKANEIEDYENVTIQAYNAVAKGLQNKMNLSSRAFAQQCKDTIRDISALL